MHIKRVGEVRKKKRMIRKGVNEKEEHKRIKTRMEKSKHKDEKSKNVNKKLSKLNSYIHMPTKTFRGYKCTVPQFQSNY